MKTPTTLAFIMIFTMIACTNNSSHTDETMAIDIETALKQSTPLHTSDFGKTMRYIPLETTDDCLIANNPQINVLKDKIIVTTESQCLVFDKYTGKFISSVGHIGNDPEGYSSTLNWIDEDNGLMYFSGYNDQLVKYDFTGRYAGKVNLPVSGTLCHMAFSESDMVGYYSYLFDNIDPKIAIFDRNGTVKDSISIGLNRVIGNTDDLTSITVYRPAKQYGNWAQSGIMIFGLKNDDKFNMALNSPVLWNHKNEIRLKEAYGDTIYTIKGASLKPYMVFKTGGYHWPEEEWTSTSNNNNRIIIPYATENDKFIFFQCIRGLYDKKILYNGIYNKDNGTTKVSRHDAAITDDLSSFKPFIPLSIASSGEYVGMVEAAHALEWLEEHPQADTSKELKFLKELTDDMNPVVILVEQ